MTLKTTKEIREWLALRDARMGELAERFGEIEIILSENYFESLASSIVGQQLSNRVADVIWGRLVKLLGGAAGGTPGVIKAPANYKLTDDYQITPQAIVAASSDALRGVGLSINKAAYLKNLSQAVLDGLDFTRINEQNDEEIIANLTQIKGIGRWTAEMFLIFSLGRQDVFSMGDGGLYNAIKKVYNLDNLTKHQLAAITEVWAPYRTFASLYLWKTLDNPL